MSETATRESLAFGSKLTQQSWDDFVARLVHDCKGDGVERHYTADAFFVVQAKRYTYGIDLDFGAELAICHEDSVYLSAKEFYENFFDDEERKDFDKKAQETHEKNFLDLFDFEQNSMMEEIDGVTVTGRAERWDYVSSHFTYEAAEAFIKRKKHDYRDGLRIYAEAQTYSWEFNAIKEAIMSGRLVLRSDESLSAPQGDLNQAGKAATVESSQGASN